MTSTDNLFVFLQDACIDLYSYATPYDLVLQKYSEDASLDASSILSSNLSHQQMIMISCDDFSITLLCIFQIIRLIAYSEGQNLPQISFELVLLIKAPLYLTIRKLCKS